MNKYKEHKYVQPQGNKYCVLYNIANVFGTDLTLLNGFKSEGIGTKDMEWIIQGIGFPKSYIAVMNNCIMPYKIPKDSIEFIIKSIRSYCKTDKFCVLPTVIRLKNNMLHSITILLSLNKIIISDPRKTHMFELTFEELLQILVAEQISVLLNFKGFRKSNLILIDI